ncbi:recombination protein NinB [Diaphorobacter nitroreducens]
MIDRITISLFEPVQAHKALMHAWTHAKAWLMSGHRLVLEVRPEKRSNPQNRLLHALIADIAAQVEWAGAKRDAEVWKRLLTAAWSRVHGQHVEVLPALDGHGVDLVPARTSKLTKAECADLCTFIEAWGAEHGVRFTAPEGWQ